MILPGLYGFRGDAIAALSFAVDRALIETKNPPIIVFPEPVHDVEKRTINVYHKKITKRGLKKLLGLPQQGKRFEEIMAS
jgi:hypothetical protein